MVQATFVCQCSLRPETRDQRPKTPSQLRFRKLDLFTMSFGFQEIWCGQDCTVFCFGAPIQNTVMPTLRQLAAGEGCNRRPAGGSCLASFCGNLRCSRIR